MNTLSKNYPLTDFNNIKELINDRTLFLDIETLGFSAAYNQIYLIGVAYMSNDLITVTLLFADTKDEESACISAFAKLAKKFATVITFNGDTFDIPFIKKRAAKHSIDTSFFDKLISFDLLKEVRRFKKILSLEKCNQKSVEAFLGICREDKYSGGELIDVYKEYIKDKDDIKKELLIQHNFDDVCGMIKLLPILSYTALFDQNFNVDTINFTDDENHIIISGWYDNSFPKDIRIQNDNYYIIVEGNKIKAALSCTEDTLKYYLPYPGKYVYLKTEKTVVPKMLASTIEPDNKRPAKPEECFVEANGQFVCVDLKLIKKNPSVFANQKLFHKEPNEKYGYIKADAQSDNSWLSEYVRLLIKSHN